MSLVTISNVSVPNNPSSATSPIAFDIRLESVIDLPEELVFRVVYLGSSSDTRFDQLLEELDVGPITKGILEFTLEVDAPDLKRIREDDLVGITGLVIEVLYKGTQFARIGYYVEGYYEDASLMEEPPEPPRYDLLMRKILAEDVRITETVIDWDKMVQSSTSS